MFENNKRKAATVYDAIAASNGFYANPVAEDVRSLMNVPFTIPSNADLEKEFISAAATKGLVGASALSTSCALLSLFVEPHNASCVVLCALLLVAGRLMQQDAVLLQHSLLPALGAVHLAEQDLWP